jgi:RNA polymerase sigma-70 factor (ECF subfamily)
MQMNKMIGIMALVASISMLLNGYVLVTSIGRSTNQYGYNIDKKTFFVTGFAVSASYSYYMQPPHDADIVQSVLQGNKAAYAILVDRHQSYVFTIISRLIPVREEAEDVSQEVFVKAYLSLAGFKGISKFSTWLYTIAHTTAISHLRKTRPATVFTNEETMEAHGGAADTHSDNHRDIKQAVNHCIKKLAPEDAEIITLYYLAEQSVEEIAAIMNLGTGNVKVKLHRARQKLKDIVAATYGKEKELLYRN